MSAVEQGTASRSEAEIGIPEFPTGLRGYDRQQVDMYVKDLAIRVTAERRRAEQAERAAAQMRAEVASFRNQPPPSFEHLGAEAARVLEAAGISAKLLIEEASHRGERIVEEAESQARELLERAERRAAELEADAGETLAVASAERERILTEAAHSVEDLRIRTEEDVRSSLEHARDAAERTRQKALSEQLLMEAETERLRESRDRMLDYLGRIHSDLGALLGEAVTPPAALVALPEATGRVVMESGEDDETETDDGEDEDDDEEGGSDDGEEGERASATYVVS